MKVLKFITVCAPLCFSLAACTPPQTVDFNGHSVKIRTSSNLKKDREAAEIQAKEICAKVGKKAEYASTTYVHDLNIQHLFLCIE